MISFIFNVLFFVIPLVFYKNTSELFEFNKITTLYIFTILIVSAWAIQSIRIKKFIFRKTILDIPLVIYLSIYLVSSLLSIDPRTSWLGYYSRFNGGLVSQVCYVLLYWAFVSNLNKKQAIHATYYILLSTAIASILAIGERFGFFATCRLMGLGYKESCWVQDVQSRVFSTLGQPNWLAALLVALIPISWAYSLRHKQNLPLRGKAYNILSVLFFVTLLFTKSRSGLLAFGIEAIIFWGFIFYKEKLKYLKEFLVILLVFGFMFFVFSSPFTNHQTPVTVTQGNSLETGGTESGTIRKYVWLGALEVFKHYPILGSGPETFAFSFPMHKPVGHNLTSEWDFIYNKAHNEYLNLLANTGILGFLSYALLIIISLKRIAGNLQLSIYNSQSISNLKISKNENSMEIENWKLKIGLLSGFIAILVTNFFGFSVVPVSLLFFLFPALAVVCSMQDVVWTKNKRLEFGQYILISCLLLSTFYILHSTFKYWKADIYYNSSNFDKALTISPNEPNYVSKSSLSDSSVETALEALKMNPYNQNSRRILISNLVKNAKESPDNLLIAEKVILDGISKAPNDPKLYYQLGILQLKIDKNTDGINSLIKSVELKPNYKDGRFALGMTCKALGKTKKAGEQFEYILKNIDPNDELTKKYLEELM